MAETRLEKRTVSDVADTVSREKYFLKNEDFPGLALRCASFVAAAETTDSDRHRWADLFNSLIASKRFIPGGRILANAGTFHSLLSDAQRSFLSEYDWFNKYDPSEYRTGQMLNCYVLPIKDSKHGPGGIYQTLEDAASITAMEGGVGENFSLLRPQGDPIRGNALFKASGPISFAHIFNESSKRLRQGGGRRGANMLVLNCDHPDIVDFITCKTGEDSLTEYNISVGMYDSFLQAVEADGDWDLKFEGKVYRTIKARYLFDLIVEHSHGSTGDGKGGGEPGFLFIDAFKREWPFPNPELICTNPCGEQALDPYEACDLGAMNLYAYVIENKNKDGTGYTFDFERFSVDVGHAIRFLDNVLDMNNYPLAYRDDVCRKISMQNRRIGLGIMGFADTLMALKIPYGQENELVERIATTFHNAAVAASHDLGREKGPFLAHKKARSTLHGRRNCCVTTIAPTGTTSMLAEVSSGCEPNYGFVMRKKTTDGSGNVYYIVSSALRTALEDVGIELTDARLEEIYSNRGSVAGLSWVPEEVQGYCQTTMDISPESHVAAQCFWQAYIENSISKTINLPNESNKSDVAEAIIGLWRGGAKGGTVYRDGSRVFQILNVGGSKPQSAPAAAQSISMDARPETLAGKTWKVSSKIFQEPENIYVTVNTGDDGKYPVEIFVHNSIKASASSYLGYLIENGVAPHIAQAVVDKISRMSEDNVNTTTRLLSVALKHRVPIDLLVKQLKKINVTDISGLHKHLARIIATFAEGQDIVGSSCEKCGEQKLIFTEGCARCTACGYSKCG